MVSTLSKSPPPNFAGARRLRPEINVTPLVDVVLVLLIIFMVSAPQLEAGERVELPSIGHVDAQAKLDSVTLTATVSGRFLLEKEVVEEGDLDRRLEAVRQKSPDKRVVLKADRAMQYGKVRALFARVQKIGFPGVALMVEEHVANAGSGGH